MTACTPLIIDTDPGVDDAFALVLALCSPEVDVRAVTVTFGNVSLDKTSANARRVLALAGRTDVPVAAGAARPLVHAQAELASDWHGVDGLGLRSDDFPEPGPADPRAAVTLMADVLRASPDPVTLVSLGPMTNTAVLLTAHPELAPRIARIVAMGGSMGTGNTRGAGEFNVYADPEAAHRVLTEPAVPVILVPLDLTMGCLADGAWLDALAAAGPRCATLVSTVTLYRQMFRERYGLDAVALHDTLAVLEAVLPGTLRTAALPISVECNLGPGRGMTVAERHPDAPGPPPVRVAPAPHTPGPPVHVALEADTPAVLSDTLRRLVTFG
jgi:pyrimidine-specific ribonucleoside hydrolase